MIRKIINIIIIFIIAVSIFSFKPVFAEDPDSPNRKYRTQENKVNTSAGSSSASNNPFSGAKDFVSTGEQQVDAALNEQGLKDASDSIYNIVIGIAIITAVAIGIVIGIKFMLASSSEKAEIKELLVPYVMGVIVVFGAIGIWKLAVSIFSDF